MTAKDEYQNVSLLEVLDRVLNKGVIIAGDLTISVADIDLLYLGLNVIVTSVETMEREKAKKRSHIS
ncbi:gas vesicle protein [Prosthecochloris sp. CIB 2401]|uniref:gas vesicle protein n=1 Tax=Prosthecochloris sp. CIB 2401 TaxID=1868325 RepID=UPI00080ABBB2|nr:gas vesicle protein [Prosthecochloris sp. CIB 2401]ANT64676.1 gas vesicle synthesis protein GvpA [Prosthecochloris sp. CIB 2401]